MATRTAAEVLERRLICQRAGIITHLVGDSEEIARRARAGLERKFEREVDPRGELPPDVRERKVRLAKKLYYTDLALARARKAKDRQRGRQAPMHPVVEREAPVGRTSRQRA